MREIVRLRELGMARRPLLDQVPLSSNTRYLRPHPNTDHLPVHTPTERLPGSPLTAHLPTANMGHLQARLDRAKAPCLTALGGSSPRSLGLRVPPSLLATAADVIE